LISANFILERQHIEWLRRTFGHKRMSAGLRAIIDEAMDESPIGTEEEVTCQQPTHN
jgi:hypothetical protein